MTEDCKYCDGDGFYLAEVPYVDYYNGGFLKEERRCCEERGKTKWGKSCIKWKVK